MIGLQNHRTKTLKQKYEHSGHVRADGQIKRWCDRCRGEREM